MTMIINQQMTEILNNFLKEKEASLLYGVYFYPEDKPICLASHNIKVLPRIKHGKLLPTKSLSIKVPRIMGVDNCYYEDGWPYIIAEDHTKTWCFLKEGKIIRRGLALNFPTNKLTLIPMNQFERNVTNEELFKLTSKDVF